MRLTQIATRRLRLGLGLLMAGIAATSGLVQAGDMKEDKMPGSELPLKEAVERADFIVVANLVQLRKLVSTGAWTSSRVKLGPVEDLKGMAGTANMSSISLSHETSGCPL